MKNIFAALLLLFMSLSLSAQNDSLIQKYRYQLQLVDSIRKYIQNTLQLNIGDDFYKKWATHTDSMSYYLYVSEPGKVEPAPSHTLGYKAYTDEHSAIFAADTLNRQGYQTLLYKTAGTSDAELTPKLLSYSNEAIAFIMVHEAVHRHINSFHFNPRYPYSFEECLCDAMANKACVAMTKKQKMLNLQAIINQKRIFEKAFRFLNAQRKKLDVADSATRADIFKNSSERIKTFVSTGNQFQKDRMIYPVNNAYFLRIESYAAHYFEVKRMLNNGLTLTEVINYIYTYKRPH